MYIGFRYTVNSSLFDFLKSTVSGVYSPKIEGWLCQQDARMLSGCSMYVVVESDYDNRGEARSNPVLIVARNQETAMRYYNETTGKENGSVLCEVLDSCKNVKVEFSGETI